jgi:response regulator RpfG family c-di-GMP phosphodiesterase
MSSVLLVDDEEAIRAVMSRWLATLGYETRQAGGAEQALDLLSREAADIMVCDIAMPGHDGLWLAERIRAEHPETAVIMATGAQEVDVALRSLQHGVVDYLVKPFSRDQLRESLGRGLEWHRDAVRARRRLEDLDGSFRERLAPLGEYLRQRPVASNADLDALVTAFAAGDRTASEHAHRVALLSVNIALALGIRDPELSDIEHAARLHDIGRFAIPEDILCKPTRLSDEERAMVQRLPALVYDLIRPCPFLASAAEIVRSAHERWDGLGYPWAMRGEEIPVGARVVAVADAFDTMTHRRLHSGARALSEAIFEVQRSRGTQFDPAAVDGLFKVVSLHWCKQVSRPAAPDTKPEPAPAPASGWLVDDAAAPAADAA